MKFKEWIKPWMIGMFSKSEIKRMETVWHFANQNNNITLRRILTFCNQSDLSEHERLKCIEKICIAEVDE